MNAQARMAAIDGIASRMGARWLVAAATVGALMVLAPAPWPRTVMLLVLSPLIEEAMFRAGLQEWLIRSGRSTATAIACTALAFALAHVLAWQQWAALWLVLPGLLLGAVYQRTRSVTLCAAAHAAMNACWLMFAWPR